MQQIEHWLKSLGLEEYVQRFVDNDIDASVLRDLTDHDLEKIGVSLGHRKKMLRALSEMADHAAFGSRLQDDVERRQLTVMFCDLVGSTALSSRLDPEELRDIIGAYLRRSTDVIVKAGGFVARYMGDGVLAYFGYPQAREDDAVRAVRAGLALIEMVAQLDSGAGTALRLRIGIATGVAVVGDLLGEGAAQERAVVGEIPNLAARLQALAEPSTVVIGGDTHRLLGKLFEYRPLGPASIKGFADPMMVWQVLQEAAIESRFEAMQGEARTPLIGREEELNILLHNWEKTRINRGQVVLLSGEAGIGKSRLIAEFEDRIRGRKYVRLRYFCSADHQDNAFYPIIAQLKRAARIESQDTTTDRVRKLRAVVARAAPLEQDIALIAQLLSIQTAELSLPDVSPQGKKELTFTSLAGLLERLAVAQPLLLLLEDAHWSDPTTLELVDLVVGLVTNQPILLLITSRPGFEPPWIARPGVSVVTLTRLDREQTAAMVARVAEANKFLADLVDIIAARADGVPLFVEELTKAVLEKGSDHIAKVGVPATLQASLMSRLDRSPAMKQVAQTAAVIGRDFSYDLLAAVASIPAAMLNQGLEQLMTSELVLHRGERHGGQYSFKHALVQDTAYESLLKGRRLEIHLRVAEEIERSSERADEVVELLAHHFTFAKCSQKAVYYLHLAGKKSLAMYSLLEAERHFLGALEQVDAEPGCADKQTVANVIAKILEVMFWKGDMPKLRGVADRYLPQLKAMGDSSDLVFASYFDAVSLNLLGEHRGAATVAQRALEAAERIGDPKAVACARVNVLSSLIALGQLSLEAAERLATQALVECSTTDDVTVEAGAYLEMSLKFAADGLMIQARQWCQKLRELGVKRGDRRVQGTSYWSMTWFDIAEERYDEALIHAQRCLEIAITPFDRVMATITGATAKVLSGSPDQGLAELYEAQHFALQNGLLLYEGLTHSAVAVGLAMTGKVAEAIRLLESSIAAGDAAGNLVVARRNRMILAKIYLTMLAGGQKAVTLRVILKNFWVILGAKLFGRRRVQSLLDRLDADVGINPQGIWRAQIDLDASTLYKLKGQRDRAIELLHTARQAAEAQNAAVLLCKIDAELAELNLPTVP